MKFARISMACLMLLAIILKSLPDSVFDFFHQHNHVSSSNAQESAPYSITEYEHNCQIEEWNFETFEVTENNFQPTIENSTRPLTVSQSELAHSILFSPIGRGPPIS